MPTLSEGFIARGGRFHFLAGCGFNAEREATNLCSCSFWEVIGEEAAATRRAAKARSCILPSSLCQVETVAVVKKQKQNPRGRTAETCREQLRPKNLEEAAEAEKLAGSS